MDAALPRPVVAATARVLPVEFGTDHANGFAARGNPANAPPHDNAPTHRGAGADGRGDVSRRAARPGPEAGGGSPGRNYWEISGFVSSTNLRSAAAAVAAFAVEETSFS